MPFGEHVYQWPPIYVPRIPESILRVELPIYGNDENIDPMQFRNWMSFKSDSIGSLSNEESTNDAQDIVHPELIKDEDEEEEEEDDDDEEEESPEPVPDYLTPCDDLEPINWRQMMSEQEDEFLKVPHLTLKEKDRVKELTSLLWNEFYNNGDITSHPEANLLARIYRIREAQLQYILSMIKRVEEDMVRKWKIQHFRVMLQLGHITLLGQDYAKANSAYQKALKIDKTRFSKDPGAYYGLALVYFHFKKYKAAVDCFNLVLYAHKDISVVPEVHARLGSCYKHLEKFELALKHYQASHADHRDATFHSKTQLRICIASCYQCSGQLTKAYEEYKTLLEELSPKTGEVEAPEQKKDRATVLRELGWVCYLFDEKTVESRSQRLLEAEEYLTQSRNLEPNSGKTFYYLGRCYGDIVNRVRYNQTESTVSAHDAFLNYRQAIDKSEGDADTWCSIGLLYQQQSQPMDALQAFICAVELDPEHSSAWTNLGQLYLASCHYADALQCYKNAIKYRPINPLPLKQRIQILEKELASFAGGNQPTPPNRNVAAVKLPPLSEAWTQPIPSELRQRQTDVSYKNQLLYREGSTIWKMADSGPVVRSEIQSGIFDILEINKEILGSAEQSIYTKLSAMQANAAPRDTLSPVSSTDLPSQEENEERSNGAEPDEDNFEIYRNELHEAVELAPEVEEVAPNEVSELPKNFSLLSQLRVPLEITSQEVLDMAGKRVSQYRDTEFRPLFDEEVMPPEPPCPTPPKESKDSLESGIRPTPMIMIENRNEAQLLSVQHYLQDKNCAIANIRGLASALRMDLSLFSTKTIVELIPSTEVEVRTQYRMIGDQNVSASGERTWDFFSKRSTTTVTNYAEYQATTFKFCLKEEAEKLRTAGAKYGQSTSNEVAAKKAKTEGGHMKQIKFGTNIDLTDTTKFAKQLKELQKLPAFCRPGGANDMLSHLGYNVLGMNTVQLYLKVPQARTPAHVENNCFASVNINVGPGECEWFGVPYENTQQMLKLCKRHGVDFLNDSWWPDFEELLENGIPVHRFTQKAGDIVYVGPGCIHWVQAIGWCNNIAWNVGPLTPFQLEVSLKSYEWNKIHPYKSLVPMQFLAWQIAKNVKITNTAVYNLIKGILIRSLAYGRMVADYSTKKGKPPKFQKRAPGEIQPYCTRCEAEVFNVLFVKGEKVGETDARYLVYCVGCADKERFSSAPDFFVIHQFLYSDLQEIFDKCKLYTNCKAPLVA